MRPTIRSRSSTEANSTTILPLRRPSSTLTRVSKLSESRSARSVSAGALTRRVGAGPAGGRLLVPGERDQLLHRAHRQSLGHDAGGQRVLGLRVVQGEQRPRVAGREHAAATRRCTGTGQVEQPDRVGDLGPTAADPAWPAPRAWCRTPRAAAGTPPPLRAGSAGRGAGSPAARRGASRRRGVPDDRRDRRQAEVAARPPPPLTHDQLVRAGPGLPDDDRLEQPELLDGGLQLLLARPRRRPAAAASAFGRISSTGSSR
jgi:hypothetical protein